MPVNEPRGQYTLENASLRARISGEEELRLVELADGATGRALLAEPAPFCRFGDQDAIATIPAVERLGAEELLVRWTTVERSATLRVRLEGPSLRWQLHITDEGDRVRIRFPFLNALRAGGDSPVQDDMLLGERAFRDHEERSIFRRAGWPLPVVWIGPEGHTLTLLVEARSLPPSFDPTLAWQAPGLELAGEAEGGSVFQAELAWHMGGWPAAFDLFRARIRAGFNLDEYRRPGLDWAGDQLVHHFTFLYGREILNLETGQFELDRLLDDGERDFGGYDGMLIWGVYPRIGVDERSQWDFYDDFPGGRPGLRAMAQRARERGVRFFIPYKPWDRSAALHGRAGVPDHEALARLAADVEADGVFLDTMAAVGGEFRAALDRARPGVLLCSESRARGAALEAITSSWDQTSLRDTQQGNWSAGEESMPAVDMGRFVFPEHRLFVINRHAVGVDRIRMIQRGFFGGTGWVVWQDIFGLVLSYSPEEARLLKKCRTILREHRQALWSAHPTPLVPTLEPGVYANEFPGESKRLWTFYNATDRAVHGAVLRIRPRPDCHFVDLWANREVEVDGDGRLAIRLEARGIGAVVELPRQLAYRRDEQCVAPLRSLPGAILQAKWRDSEWTEPAEHGLDLARAAPAGGVDCVVRLLQDGELLDQIDARPGKSDRGSS